MLCRTAWGCSSAGRTPHWQCGCQGFESPQLHHSSIRAAPLIVLPVQRKVILSSSARRMSLKLMLIVTLLLLPMLSARLIADDTQKFTRPDVLVLVLGGIGSSEMVSINYTGVVALPKAQADLDTIAAAGKWQATNARGETKSSGGPNPKPTTSITFQAKGVIDYVNGALPLEPFIVGLKRFKFIEVDYMIPQTFQFKGLKDFENEFVKIQMSPSGNSYRYRIVVKNADFTKLGLPLAQPTATESKQVGMPVGKRVLLAFGLAILGAGIVYLVTAYLLKRKASA